MGKSIYLLLQPLRLRGAHQLAGGAAHCRRKACRIQAAGGEELAVAQLLVAGDDVVNMFPDQTRTFDVLSNDVNNTGGTLTITAINGVPVSVGDTVTLPSGEQVTLNADGTLTFVTDSDGDSVSLTYEVTSSTGATCKVNRPASPTDSVCKSLTR